METIFIDKVHIQAAEEIKEQHKGKHQKYIDCGGGGVQLENPALGERLRN